MKPVKLPSHFGTFELELIEQEKGEPHVVVMKEEQIQLGQAGVSEAAEVPLVRIHSECLTGDVFGSKRCECGPQLEHALKELEEAGYGYIFYLRQEGRGIGLIAKMQAYKLQEAGMDTVQANTALGFGADERTYEMVGKWLVEKGIKKIKLLTNNPEKVKAIEAYGIEVNREKSWVGHDEHNANYLKTKREYFGHYLETDIEADEKGAIQ